MKPPIRADKQEELILYYSYLHYLRIRGEIFKIYDQLELKAREMGISISTAWRIIRHGRRVGMIDMKANFG